MACADVGSIIQALLSGQFFYIFCEFENQIGMLGFPILILGCLAVGLSIQNQSVLPFIVFGMTGGAALLLNANNANFGIFNTILYIAIVFSITGAIFLLLSRLSKR
jgi:hypothetical protein